VGDVWSSFKAAFGPVLTGAALILAIPGPLYAPTATVQVSLIWLTIAGSLSLTLLWTAINMGIAVRRSASQPLPRTRQIVVPDRAAPGADPSVILVLDRSSLFGFNILVTIYYSERLDPRRGDVFERAIGIGRVVNVQQNGLIQVLVLAELPGNADLWQRTRNREAAALAQLVVKPSVLFDAAGVEVRFQ